MPYATSTDGTRIFYTTVGSGPPLLLVHGVTHTWESWQDLGYVDALYDAYQLVLVDLRGHGASDKPHDSTAYSLPLQVDDIVAVLDDLDIAQAHFWGYSLGALIGFHLGARSPGRLRSFIAHGLHPYPASPEEQTWRDEIIATLRRGMAAWVEYLERGGVLAQYPEPSARRERLLAADAAALVASCTAIGEDVGVAEQLSRLRMPCLVLVGELDPGRDQARRAAQALPQAEFVSMAGVGHALGHARQVLPFVRPFLGRIRRDGTTADGAPAGAKEGTRGG